MERLDKFLCDCGIGTRSQVKQLLKTGRVTLDGKPVGDGSTKFDPAQTAVCLDGQSVSHRGRLVVMLNKPAGYVTATGDDLSPTVMELLPKAYKHLKPIGRLDKQTEGLLLFTDDGDLLHRLISPKKEVPKVYYAEHEGQAGEEDVAAFAAGLTLRDGLVCQSALLEPLGPGKSRITVCEGKYHQVKRMLAARGKPVTALRRLSVGALRLPEELAEGAVVELDDDDLCRVFIVR